MTGKLLSKNHRDRIACLYSALYDTTCKEVPVWERLDSGPLADSKASWLRWVAELELGPYAATYLCRARHVGMKADPLSICFVHWHARFGTRDPLNGGVWVGRRNMVEEDGLVTPQHDLKICRRILAVRVST